MPHARYRAGMDAFPLPLLDESKVDAAEEDAMATLLRHIVPAQACLTRSVALVKASQSRLDAADKRLRHTLHMLHTLRRAP